jgi:hypothetical protein
MGPSTGDGGRSRNSILLAMSDRDWRWLRRRRGIDDRVTDVPRRARPDARPRPDAQWDEAAGRWEVWSEERQGWVSLEDGTVQAPGTRSVDPSADGVLKPPPLDLR